RGSRDRHRSAARPRPCSWAALRHEAVTQQVEMRAAQRPRVERLLVIAAERVLPHHAEQHRRDDAEDRMIEVEPGAELAALDAAPEDADDEALAAPHDLVE